MIPKDPMILLSYVNTQLRDLSYMQYEKCSPTAIPAVREHFTYFLYELIGCLIILIVDGMHLRHQELSLELTDAAKDQVIENGYDPVYGARPLKRYLQKYVETLAARKILSGDVHAGDTLVLDVQNGEFIVTVKDGN